MKNMQLILQAVQDERLRQNKLVEQGKIPFNCADKARPHSQKLPILVEEIGEVAQAMMQVTTGSSSHDAKRDLQKELIQVAAVAVAWAESLA
jgi:NTP pyrophosphatase (non-canonical NTP hydrolase)